MRGWVSYVTQRYKKANNKYTELCDKYKNIIFKDTDNLQRCAISEHLCGFKWLTQVESDWLNVNRIRKYNPKSCKLKADLENPKELLDLHKDVI